MQGVFRVYGDERVRESIIGANSEVFKDGTFVSINSSGYLIVATAGLKIWGVCRQDVTMASDNQTVAQVKPYVIESQNVDSHALGDQAFVQANAGNYAAISTVSNGLQTIQLSAASATQGALKVIGLLDTLSGNPAWSGNTTQVVVRPSTPQDLAFTAT